MIYQHNMAVVYILLTGLALSTASCRKGPLKIGPLMIDESPEIVAEREEEERGLQCAILFHRVHSLYRSGEGSRKQNRFSSADLEFERAILTIEEIRKTCPGWNVKSLHRLEEQCSAARNWIARRVGEKDARVVVALRKFAVAHDAAPDSSAPFVELGRFYFEEGEYIQAMKQYEEALLEDPMNAEIMIEVARVFTHAGYIDEAKEIYGKVITINPGIPTVHYNLGGIYFQEGMPTYAIREYTKALELDPEYADAHNALGLVNKQLGRYDLAIRHFKRALSLDPNDPRAHYNLGIAFLAKNNYETGRGYLNRARELFGPETPMGRSISDKMRRLKRHR